MTKKEQLYYLLNAYQKKEYDVKTFCQAFEGIFYPDTPSAELTKKEYKIFDGLGEKILRFSPFEEDEKKYPKVYFSEADINRAINECFSELGKQ